jgi:hypothetical protein
MQTSVRAAILLLGAAVSLSPVASLAASEFEGTWRVKDSDGRPFDIILSQNAAAKASRGEGMTGTWREEGKAAVITWDTGWKTKIAKEGGRFKKTAYRRGQPLDSAAANSSDAEKAK